jgi:hypothetical protein
MALIVKAVLFCPVRGQKLDVVEVEGQPLAANVQRLLQALDYLGFPLATETAPLQRAIKDRDASRIQKLLDPHVLVQVTLNPESRVKAARGPAAVALQQGAFVPVVVKVVNESTVTKTLRLTSPQAGPVYSGGFAGNTPGDKNRFLELEMFAKPPMTANLSGLKVEYAIALIYSSEAGMREATVAFDVGQGSQDLGFRGEVPILFHIRPGIHIKLSVRDVDGSRLPVASRSPIRPATCIHQRRNAWHRTSFSRTRFTGRTVARCCCRPAS